MTGAAANASTLASSAFDRIRSDILVGAYRPGEWIRIEALRCRYRTSASPLREALHRLVAEEWVVQCDQRGFRVAGTSREKLAALTRDRCLLNEVVVPAAIARATEADLDAVVLAHHRMARGPGPSPGLSPAALQDWELWHMAFHASLVAPCGSRWLIDADRSLSEQARRYRSVAGAPAYAARRIDEEHRTIMEAFIARDADRATRLLNDHVMRTARTIAGADGALPGAGSDMFIVADGGSE